MMWKLEKYLAETTLNQVTIKYLKKQQLMTNPNQELLQEQLNINANETNTDNSSYSYKRLEDTPFGIAGSNNDGWFLTLGNYRMTDVMKTENDVIDYINDNMWDLIIKIFTVCTDLNNQLKTNNND